MGAPALRLIAVAFLGAAQSAKPEITPLRATYRTTVLYQGRVHDAGSRTVTVVAVEDEWRDRVEIRRAPQNESWGARMFDVIDPFGKTIFVMGPVK